MDASDGIDSSANRQGRSIACIPSVSTPTTSGDVDLAQLISSIHFPPRPAIVSLANGSEEAHLTIDVFFRQVRNAFFGLASVNSGPMSINGAFKSLD